VVDDDIRIVVHRNRDLRRPDEPLVGQRAQVLTLLWGQPLEVRGVNRPGVQGKGDAALPAMASGR
jgi:hypothetical protein